MIIGEKVYVGRKFFRRCVTGRLVVGKEEEEERRELAYQQLMMREGGLGTWLGL